MKNTFTFPLFALYAALALAACVPQRQLLEAQAQRDACADESAQLEAELAGVSAQHQSALAAGEAKDERLLQLQDTATQRQEELQALSHRYAALMAMQEAAQRGSQQEMRALLAKIQHSQEALLDKEDELLLAERALAERSEAVRRLSQDLEERNGRLLALERALHQKDSTTNALRRKLSDALLNFEGKGLTVKVRNGKVYVSMEDKLLFASGSFEVDARGAEAIRSITGVLEKNPDINVLIEGHTDDVPYLGRGQLADNWDLSCKRATSVVRLLLKGSTIEEQRITAAGRAEHLPLKKAATADARQANRRIEIILTPQLDEVLKMLQ